MWVRTPQRSIRMIDWYLTLLKIQVRNLTCTEEQKKIKFCYLHLGWEVVKTLGCGHPANHLNRPGQWLKEKYIQENIWKAMIQERNVEIILVVLWVMPSDAHSYLLSISDNFFLVCSVFLDSFFPLGRPFYFTSMAFSIKLLWKKKKANPNNTMAEKCVLLMEMNSFIVDFAYPFGDSSMHY